MIELFISSSHSDEKLIMQVGAELSWDKFIGELK